MDHLFLHISGKEVKDKIPLKFQPESRLLASSLHSHEISTLRDDFGSLVVEQNHFAGRIIRRIRARLDKSVSIEISHDLENISLIYAEKGYLQFNSIESEKELIAQNLIKIVPRSDSLPYFISLDVSKQEEILATIIVIPFTIGPDSLSDHPELIAYFKRSIVRYKYEKAAVANLPFKRMFLEIIEELNKTLPNISLMTANMTLMFIESIRNIEIQKIDMAGLTDWDPGKQAAYQLAESIILSMDERLTIAQFARTRYMNPNKLKILFKEHMGMPVNAFRIEVRM